MDGNNIALLSLSLKIEISDQWLEEYNEGRPHESLGNLTPREYALSSIDVQ